MQTWANGWTRIASGGNRRRTRNLPSRPCTMFRKKLRTGEAIEGQDRDIYQQGLIAVLSELHEQIDREVAAAYGWSADLADEEIMKRLVALNRERTAEEATGQVRWLRPDLPKPDRCNQGVKRQWRSCTGRGGKRCENL